jgi:ABC-type glycerol-3-phosphate transport system permease component
VHRRRTIPWKAAGRHAVLVLLSCWALFPLVIVVIDSVESRVDSVHNNIWPSAFVNPVWARYEWVWTDFSLDNVFFRLYWNSLFVTGMTVLIGTVSALLGGYALVHLKSPAQQLLSSLLVASMFFPTQVTALTGIFKVQYELGLINKTWSLFFPYTAMMVALSVFVMRGVFQTVPKEIVDSARLDGASSLRTLLGVLLPMVKNGVIVVVILAYMTAWGEYLLAALLMNDRDTRTLAVELSGGGVGPGSAALLIVAMLPGLLAFVIAQNWFLKGLQDGALRG